MNQRKPAGTAGRIRRRLRALGFWKDGRPDVLRFCLEHRYLPQNLYAWLKGRVPTVEYLTRLAADLAVSPSWLLFGNAPPGGWAGAEIRQTIRPSPHVADVATAAAGAKRPPGRPEEAFPREHEALHHDLRHGPRAR